MTREKLGVLGNMSIATDFTGTNGLPGWAGVGGWQRLTKSLITREGE